MHSPPITGVVRRASDGEGEMRSVDRAKPGEDWHGARGLSACAGPGDYLYIAPNVIHQELNLSDSELIDCIVIRDSQENLVINVDLPES